MARRRLAHGKEQRTALRGKNPKPPEKLASWRVSFVIRFWSGRILLLLASKDTKNLLQRVLFIFSGLAVLVPWGCSALTSCAGGAVGVVGGRIAVHVNYGLRHVRLAAAENVGEERAGGGDDAVAAAVNFAHLRRGGSLDVDLFTGAGAVRGGEFERFGIDHDGLNAVGGREVLHVFVGRELRGVNHEVGPDGRVGSTAGDSDVAVVVEADPDDADEIIGKAGKPGVARRAGLPCCGEREAARADAGGGAVVHDVFHQTGDEIGDAGIENVFGLRRGFFEGFAIGADNAFDELGLGARSAVGEGGVGCCDIDRRHFVGAERDCGSGLNVLAEAHLARDLDDAAVADQFGDFYGGDVERVGEGFTRGDAAHELGAVVVRRVFLAVEFEGGRLVVDGGGRRDDGLHVVDGVVERGGVDEWLENRSGLAMRERVIELALAVVAAADDGFDFAGTRVERDERGLDMGNRFVASLFRSFLFPPVVFLGEQLVYVFRAFFDRVLRDALQRWIKRGVYAEIFGGELLLGIFIEQVVLHHVDKVRSLATGDGSANDF